MIHIWHGSNVDFAPEPIVRGAANHFEVQVDDSKWYLFVRKNQQSGYTVYLASLVQKRFGIRPASWTKLDTSVFWGTGHPTPQQISKFIRSL